MITLTQFFMSLYIASVSPNYTVAIDSNFQIYVCSLPEHFDPIYDNEIDTYQMIDLQTCFNCSTENNLYKSFCDNSISFDYRRYVNNTFGYSNPDNVTANLMQIVHTNQFTIDDYYTFLDVWSADCLETNDPTVCYDALFLSANLFLFLEKQNNN